LKYVPEVILFAEDETISHETRDFRVQLHVTLDARETGRVPQLPGNREEVAVNNFVATPGTRVERWIGDLGNLQIFNIVSPQYPGPLSSDKQHDL